MTSPMEFCSPSRGVPQGAPLDVLQPHFTHTTVTLMMTKKEEDGDQHDEEKEQVDDDQKDEADLTR